VRYLLDVDPLSFRDARVAATLGQARTIFVNAVMASRRTSRRGRPPLDETIDQNRGAMKLYGGGDTLQEFKNLCPGLYLSVMDNARYYFFTGGARCSPRSRRAARTAWRPCRRSSPTAAGPGVGGTVAELVRFGISIPGPLLESFDALIEGRGTPTARRRSAT